MLPADKNIQIWTVSSVILYSSKISSGIIYPCNLPSKRSSMFLQLMLSTLRKKRVPPTRCPVLLPRLQTAGTKPRTSM